jgi:sialidase-1
MKKMPFSGRLYPSCLLLLMASALACTRNVSPTEKPTPTADDVATNSVVAAAAAPYHNTTVLFNGGSEGYHSYRIPSIVRTNAGTLIAFAEGRMSDNKDYGNINLVFKRSTNHGSTWSALGEVVGVGPGTWGNPTAVVDRNTGRVWLWMSWNSGTTNQGGTDGYDPIDTWGERKVYVSWSDDDGVSWATPVDKTSSLLPPGFTWDAMGPGVGLQTSVDHPGRIIIPANRRNIYSDDHGATWQYQLVPNGSGEPTIIELIDGRLQRNDRPGSAQFETAKRRWISTGNIETGWSAWAPHNTLLDPRCEGSVLRYTGEPSRIMFLNPASTERRCKMRIRISYDEGVTWPISRRTHDWLTDDETCDQGKGGYSSMAKTADYAVGALIEINEDVSNNATSHRSIEFHKFNLPWILNGATEP